MGYRLDELAARFGLESKGDPATLIEGVCTLDPGHAGCLGFLSNPKYRGFLQTTRAAAVVLAPKVAAMHEGAALIAPDPYLAFARVARLFDDEPTAGGGVHPTAVVEAGANLAGSAWVGPQALIESGAVVGEGAFIGPGSIVSRAARIGAGTRLEARVWVGRRCVVGARCRLQPGAVVGSRGFGNARTPEGWEEVPQLGIVRIGDDVEVGANTTIDRGAIDDTVIGNGVKLDNQIQIAHNVHIGEHTAIAACVGIAGSTRIGRRCLIGGGCGINGHIEIGDDVVILGFAMVTKSLPGPGQYGSGLPIEPVRQWRKTVARVRRLEKLESRLDEVEDHLQIDSGNHGEESGE